MILAIYINTQTISVAQHLVSHHHIDQVSLCSSIPVNESICDWISKTISVWKENRHWMMGCWHRKNDLPDEVKQSFSISLWVTLTIALLLFSLLSHQHLCYFVCLGSGSSWEQKQSWRRIHSLSKCVNTTVWKYSIWKVPHFKFYLSRKYNTINSCKGQ